ncbi:hypothetical protein [Micromonospora sp. NPDC023737]|uniref:hypothetical protein n=1 Tax=unclassified Micromonospora TaxID=2617518 RepID=UPI0033D3C98D
MIEQVRRLDTAGHHVVLATGRSSRDHHPGTRSARHRAAVPGLFQRCGHPARC